MFFFLTSCAIFSSSIIRFFLLQIIQFFLLKQEKHVFLPHKFVTKQERFSSYKKIFFYFKNELFYFFSCVWSPCFLELDDNIVKLG
jgi:hypothetical protein